TQLNNSGWIVGYGTIDGATHGFVARPEPSCPADFNSDDSVNSQDFFDFVSAFFADAPAADFNHDGSINSQDYFDFLTAFFAGCSTDLTQTTRRCLWLPRCFRVGRAA